MMMTTCIQLLDVWAWAVISTLLGSAVAQTLAVPSSSSIIILIFNSLNVLHHHHHHHRSHRVRLCVNVFMRVCVCVLRPRLSFRAQDKDMMTCRRLLLLLLDASLCRLLGLSQSYLDSCSPTHLHLLVDCPSFLSQERM